MRQPETGEPLPPLRLPFRSSVIRLWQSAVVWAWGFNGLRLASGVLLLPLLLTTLSTPDLGFYYVLLSLASIAPLLDFGLSVSIDRNVSYAMGGIVELRSSGLNADAQRLSGPNYSLVWKLLFATRRIYAFLAFVLIIILGFLGTYVVSLRIHETTAPGIAWFAWALTLLSAAFEIYSGWWNVFLKGLNNVVSSARILFIVYATKLIISCGLLLGGAGLLSIPIAGIIAGFMSRFLSRKTCLNLLLPHPAPPISQSDTKALLRILWPNSWRVGLQLSSGYLGTNLNAIVCLSVFGLAANAEYGISVQIASIIQGMSSVWINVKWPLVSQYRTRHDNEGLRRLLWPRVWLQIATFVLLAAIVCLAGSHLLAWIGSGKRMLPIGWFVLLIFNAFLETKIAFWTTLLSTENVVPSLRAVVLTNILTFVAVMVLVHTTHIGLGAFILAPFVMGSLFNYWYWPKAGALSLQTTWLRFMFSRPK